MSKESLIRKAATLADASATAAIQAATARFIGRPDFRLERRAARLESLASDYARAARFARH